MSSDTETIFWKPRPDGRVKCTLCPRLCNIPKDKPGFCFVRQNIGGRMVNVAYGRPTAVHIDPIEKKPLYHFLPGTRVLSLGTAGCNMGCRFCQNWDLSRADEVQRQAVDLSPAHLVEAAIRNACPSIAFTYNEPTILAEYVIDTAEIARRKGVKVVMVTNGYISREAIPQIYANVDAANIDLKAFSNTFYRKQTYSRLQPVLDALVDIRSLGVWIEITTLLIPGLNTDASEIRAECDWIIDSLGDEVPVHFSAFHPDYRMRDRDRTPPEALRDARTIANDAGLKYVYEGNVHSDGGNTYCPSCGEILIQRHWHEVVEDRITPEGVCPRCGEGIGVIR